MFRDHSRGLGGPYGVSGVEAGHPTQGPLCCTTSDRPVRQRLPKPVGVGTAGIVAGLGRSGLRTLCACRFSPWHLGMTQLSPRNKQEPQMVPAKPERRQLARGRTEPGHGAPRHRACSGGGKDGQKPVSSPDGPLYTRTFAETLSTKAAVNFQNILHIFPSAKR